MDIGVTVRNMGPQSDPATLLECTKCAEACGFESIWITDHIAIAPDDAEGSGGRYLDPLTTLSYLAGHTNTIKLGTGVIILPYRPPLPTAKQVATLQELSGGRLVLGIGVGWMDAEFNALGLTRRTRGRVTDDTLQFLNRCFAQDVVEAHGQKFIFKPRPTKPPVLVGGRAPHALQRAAKYADGWLPMAPRLTDLSADIKKYRELTDRYDKPAGQVCVLTGLPTSDIPDCKDRLEQLADIGVSRVVAAIKYDTSSEYRTQIEALSAIVG